MVFPNFRLICSYFVLATIIIFDLALRMYTSHTCRVFLTGYGWFEGKNLYFNTQICVYHILFTDGTTDYPAAEDFDGINLYCKVSSELVHSVHSLLICVKFQLI